MKAGVLWERSLTAMKGLSRSETAPTDVMRGLSRSETAPTLLVGVLVALPMLAWAAPDAGSVLQQLEARPGGVLVAPKLQTPQVPTPPAADPGGPVVRVNDFRLEGQTLLTADVLHAALAGFKGRDLSLTQLQEAAWVLVQTYRSAGWLVHAVVPPQEIEGGIVTLRVIEARLGKVRIDFPPGRLPRELIEAMAQAHLPAGQPVNLQQVDRLLLVLGDMPGLAASASFAEGAVPGSTDVLVKLGKEKAVQASVMVDNFGGVSTGRDRLSAYITLNNPMGLGDALQLQGVRSQGTEYGRVAWTLPVGVQGSRAGLHATSMNYHLVGSFAPLQARGSAQSWGFDLSVPMVRQPDRNLSAQFTTDRKHFNNLSGGSAGTDPVTVSRYQLDVLRAGLVGNWLDQLFTPAQNALSLQSSWGEVDLSQSPNAQADASGARTAGWFRKVNLNYNREQRLGGQTSAYLQAGAQWANRNLDSSERIYLGGASGVRAYPSNEAGGSTGTTATLGLRHRLDAAFSLNAFVDRGRIHVYHDNVAANGSALALVNGQSLQGRGLALVWRSPQGHELSATWSRRHGRNPGANTTTGADSDGTLTLHRFWLSATLNY